jgi:hypothetical protein
MWGFRRPDCFFSLELRWAPAETRMVSEHTQTSKLIDPDYTTQSVLIFWARSVFSIHCIVTAPHSLRQ